MKTKPFSKASSRAIRRAAIYGRVSSTEQAQGHSLDYQADACRAYAEKIGATEILLYEDPGYSATTANRPEFQRLIADAEDGKLDAIIVFRLDRFSRSRLDALLYKERLRAAGVKLLSVSEPLDNTPAGVLTEGLFELMAEHYSLDLSFKVSKGKHKRAEKGLPNGLTPFGYVQMGNPQVDPPSIVPHESDAVRMAYELFSTGAWSSRDIAERLNEKGYRTRHRPTRNAGDGERLWSDHSVRSMNQNPIYKGKVTLKGEELPGRHEPIVTPELWEQANRVSRRLRGKSTSTSSNRFYPLAGIIKCAGCGSNLQGNHSESGKAYRYYRETAMRRGISCDRPQIAVRADIVEAEVDSIVSGFQSPAELRQRVIELLGSEIGEDHGTSVERVKEKLRRATRLYSDLILSEREYVAQKTRLEAELARFEVPTQKADTAVAEFDVLQLAWSRALPQEKRSLGLSLFEAIYFDMATMTISEVVVDPAFRPWIRSDQKPPDHNNGGANRR